MSEDKTTVLEDSSDDEEYDDDYRGPGRWIKTLKDHLQDEVVEGRLGKDDREKARELAEAYAREHHLFEE